MRNGRAMAAGLAGWLSAIAAAQSVELELVTDAAAPGWAAIDFRQVLSDAPLDAWLAGQITAAEALNGARFRLISDVHPADPNHEAYLTPDRDGGGVSLAEQFTTFLNEPRSNPHGAARFGAAATPSTIGSPQAAYAPERLAELGAIDRDFGGPGGYWCRVAIELPAGIPLDSLYVATALASAADLPLAEGVVRWGTESTAQDGGEPAEDTAWVIAAAGLAPVEEPAGPPEEPLPGEPDEPGPTPGDPDPTPSGPTVVAGDQDDHDADADADPVDDAPTPVAVGCGPAGLSAALWAALGLAASAHAGRRRCAPRGG